MTQDLQTFAHTERSVLDALRARHAPKDRGNGPEWAFLEHVRDSAGFKAKRTIDALGLGLWPSRGLELHGFEVKVSRADFRREIADPAKMDAFAHVLDRFWIVAPKGIVPRDELPATWGLLEVGDDGTSIRQKVAAPLLTEERTAIPREFLVPMLRAAGASVKSRPDDLQAEYDRGFTDGARSSENWQHRYEVQATDLDEARDQVAEINRALGVEIDAGWRREDRAEQLRKVSTVVKAVVGGEDVQAKVEHAIQMAHRHLSFAKDSVARVQKSIEAETGVKR